MKALEKDRTRRYQTANALGARCPAASQSRAGLGRPAERRLPNAQIRAASSRRASRRSRHSSCSVLVFAGMMTVQARRIARERDRANQEAATAKQVSDFLVGLFKVSDPSEARGRHADSS